MGRARKVDRETAIESALSAFWVHGYKALGVRKLEELTGINRFALQTEFGGKNGLFLEIAKTYISYWGDTHREAIRNGTLDELADFFLERTQKNSRAEMNSGCLIFNTLGDEQPDAPEIRQLISGFLDTIQATFAAALHNERAAGTLVEDLDIDQASQMLLSTLIGMNMLIKARGCNEAGRPAALGAQKTIMSWRTTT